MTSRLHCAFHDDGTLPEKRRVFVFGSNLHGSHSAGAALAAFELFGADRGVGVGRVGYSYAIPTKDLDMNVMTATEIKPYVDGFCAHVQASQDVFFVTRIGCGLAGHDDADIAPMFASLAQCPRVSFAREWRKYLQRYFCE